MATPGRVTLHGDISGEYLVEETLPDGRILLSPNTSIAQIHIETGTVPMSREEFDEILGDLPSDHEG